VIGKNFENIYLLHSPNKDLTKTLEFKSCKGAKIIKFEFPANNDNKDFTVNFKDQKKFEELLDKRYVGSWYNSTFVFIVDKSDDIQITKYSFVK